MKYFGMCSLGNPRKVAVTRGLCTPVQFMNTVHSISPCAVCSLIFDGGNLLAVLLVTVRL